LGAAAVAAAHLVSALYVHGPKRAAEVCKLVQLSSGSAVYPERHDAVCLLRAAGHDEDRVDP
jgi:hypothetical protein